MPALKIVRASGITETSECTRIKYNATDDPIYVDVYELDDSHQEYVFETVEIAEGDKGYFMVDGTTTDVVKVRIPAQR